MKKLERNSTSSVQFYKPFVRERNKWTTQARVLGLFDDLFLYSMGSLNWSREHTRNCLYLNTSHLELRFLSLSLSLSFYVLYKVQMKLLLWQGIIYRYFKQMNPFSLYFTTVLYQFHHYQVVAEWLCKFSKISKMYYNNKKTGLKVTVSRFGFSVCKNIVMGF